MLTKRNAEFWNYSGYHWYCIDSAGAAHEMPSKALKGRAIPYAVDPRSLHHGGGRCRPVVVHPITNEDYVAWLDCGRHFKYDWRRGVLAEKESGFRTDLNPMSELA